MYTLLHAMPLKQILAEQIPVVLVSLIIAELFYKFHSFTLEAMAFLATWYVLDSIVKALVDLFSRRHTKS
jgi:hypothetical protein